MSLRPQIDHIRCAQLLAAVGVMTQITGSLGNGAHLVALEQAWDRACADDRWEPGMKIKLGWHPRHCLVLQ